MVKKTLLAAGMAAAVSLGASALASAHGVGEVCADQPCGWHFGPMTGQGHMGQGHMHMMGPGMMGQGMGPGMMGQGMGPGMMGQGMGPGMMGHPGMMQPLSRDLSAEDVQHM